WWWLVWWDTTSFFLADRGWDVFTLHYTVRGPLSTMLEPSMIKYHMLFKRLWALKHVEYVVCSKIWKDMICHAKLLRSMKKDLTAITIPLQFYTSTMIHFIQQIQYYILFEVIECSWMNMLERIEKARALDDILEAHQEFLKDAHDGAFFNLNANIFSTMDSAFSACLKLEKWQQNFYDLCMKELSARKAEEEMIKISGVKGKYGLTADKRLERDQERKLFEECLPKLNCELKVIVKDFETHARTVLLALASSNDHNLQLFGTRLDFNEYYKKRDQNLDAPLTFAKLRVSSMMVRQRNSNNRYNN
ncbi:Gamma-tubulin complex component 3, partial [Pseudolycoriella hygida]